MGKQQISELLATLDAMEALAGDVMDGVAVIRTELVQTFEEIEQMNEEWSRT